MPRDTAPYIGGWRSIRAETYKKFEAFLSPSKEFSGRICFPIEIALAR